VGKQKFSHAPSIVLEYLSQSQVAVVLIPQVAYSCQKHNSNGHYILEICIRGHAYYSEKISTHTSGTI